MTDSNDPIQESREENRLTEDGAYPCREGSPDSCLITACMMVKNEEEMLPRCLESIRGRVDEIVVVDTGSTDRTVEIARSFGARVHHHPWRNDFSLHRNQSISYASEKWVFIIDADEEYRPSPRASLREETALADEKGFDTLVMRVENLHREGTETVCSDSLRVFRRNGRIRYEGIVHNELTGWGNPGSSTGRIVHYGYDRGTASARRKFERTATLLRKQIAENPENAGAHMYLSCSHASLGQNEEALREALAAVDLVEAQGITNVHFTRAYYGAVRCLILEKRYGEAEALCERARARFGDQIDLYAALTMIRFETGDWEGVVASGIRYRELLEAHRKFRGPSVMTHVSSYGDEWKVCGWMGTARLRLGDIEGAEALYRTALPLSPDRRSLLRHAGLSLVSSGHIYRARPYLEEARNLPGGPADSKTVEALFKIAVLTGDGPLAQRSVRDALSIPGDSGEWLIGLSDFALPHGNARSALLLLSGIIGADDGNIPARLKRARILVSHGMIEEAVGECDALLRILSLPRNRTLHSLSDLADLFRRIGEKRKGENHPEDGRTADDISRLLLHPPAAPR